MNERISDAELAIMKILWEDAPLTATDIAGRVERDWTITTVKTLLSRLVSKNALSNERDGRRFLYSPLVAKDAYIDTESQRFVDRLFGGKFMPLVAHLAEKEKLSSKEITEIEQILKDLKS